MACWGGRFRSVDVASNDNILKYGVIVVVVGGWDRRAVVIYTTGQCRVVFLDYSAHCHFMNKTLPGIGGSWAGRGNGGARKNGGGGGRIAT